MNAFTPPAGLCESCVHRKLIATRTGSEFTYCRLSDADARFPRYPALPVLSCAGYEPVSPEH